MKPTLTPYRIACVFPGIYRGGSEQVLFNLTRGFQALGHTVSYFSLKPMDPKEMVLDPDLPQPILLTQNKNKLFNININFRCLRQKRLNQTIQAYEAQHGAFNLILSNINTRNPLKSQHPDRIFYFLHIDPWAGTHCRYAHQPKRFAKEIARLRACYQDKQVIAVSQGAADALLQKIHAHPKSLQVIYNPFDSHKIRAQALAFGPPLDQPYLLHVGRFDPQKRHDLLLTAYQKLKNPPKLVLLTHVTEPLIQLIARFGLTDQVLLPGMQSNPFPWIQQAKALILCSDWEGFGNVIVEALMCHTPVISTDCPSGPHEILTGHLATGLAPLNDPERLAQKIQEILHNPYPILPQDTERFEMRTILPQYLSLIS